MQEKIPWIEANYKHYFRKEKLYLLLPSFSASKKNKKQKQKRKLEECRTGHVLQDNLSELEIHWFYCTNSV